MKTLSLNDAITDKAIAWFVRLRADDVTQTERGEFFSWLSEHREHQLAFLKIVKLWNDLSVIKDMDFEELRELPEIWKFKKKVELRAVS